MSSGTRHGKPSALRRLGLASTVAASAGEALVHHRKGISLHKRTCDQIAEQSSSSSSAFAGLGTVVDRGVAGAPSRLVLGGRVGVDGLLQSENAEKTCPPQGFRKAAETPSQVGAWQSSPPYSVNVFRGILASAVGLHILVDTQMLIELFSQCSDSKYLWFPSHANSHSSEIRNC